MTIIEKAKKRFQQMIDDFGKDPYCLYSHVPETERWAKYMLKKYPKADKEIVLLAVWLHDVGHYPIPSKIDHAVRSEKRAKQFLKKENYDEKKMEKVLHCIRAHRCRDVMPETFEAKLIAFIDSASHMTDKETYVDMVRAYKNVTVVLEKLERDFRDMGHFPEQKKKFKYLYESWKQLLTACEKAEGILDE